MDKAQDKTYLTIENEKYKIKRHLVLRTKLTKRKTKWRKVPRIVNGCILIRGTFRHFVFHLVNLIRKIESLFISYFSFLIGRLIFDSFILCFLHFSYFLFLVPFYVLSFLSFSLFTFLFSFY